MPVTGPNDPAFWRRDNYQSLCFPCHGLKSWRESLGWVVYWEQRPNRVVITGKPATGKTWFCKHILKPAEVWDLDEVAVRMGYAPAYPRPRYQLSTLLQSREKFIGRMQQSSDDVLALVVSGVAPAYRVSEQLRATLVHMWADEPERQSRLARRASTVCGD